MFVLHLLATMMSTITAESGLIQLAGNNCTADSVVYSFLSLSLFQDFI